MQEAKKKQGWLWGVLLISAEILALLVVISVIIERSTRMPFVRAGDVAPAFHLPATDGTTVSPSEKRGHIILLAFVPSVLCDARRQQSRLDGHFPLSRRPR